MTTRAFGILLATLLGCSSSSAPTVHEPLPEAPPIILPSGCGHAHNDYLHDRPLFDALERGFCSIEVDVFLVGDELLVAHTAAEIDPARTLESLYLGPLRTMHQAGGIQHGGDGPLLLLIDVKSGAEDTYAALHEVLAAESSWLTRFEGEAAIAGEVTAVISGNRDRAAMEAQPLRHAAMDGRLADLGTGAPRNLIPLISQAWFFKFLWMGDGDIPDDERQLLRSLARDAHDEGRRLRFWSIPDRPNVWQTLLDEGVDLINTDDLDGFAAFAAP